MKLRIRILLGVVLSALLLFRAEAWPIFNPPGAELAKLSADAAIALLNGHQQVLEMLVSFERNDAKAANVAKEAAEAKFQQAMEGFQRVMESAQDQPIVFNVTTADQRDALTGFNEGVNRLNMKYPATERQLAALALLSVKSHLSLLRDTKFSGTRGDYKVLKKVLDSQAFVTDLGLVTSIVWATAGQKR